MGVFEWFYGEVPESLAIKQVYGVIFDKFGRVLLMIDKTKTDHSYSLSGGTPEKFDIDRVATLKRELVEEINTTIGNDVYMLGYQQVNEGNGVPIYAQVRMTALIDKIGERKPDPANGKTYERLLTSPENAIKLLDWREGNIGEKIIREAVRIAKKKFNIKSFLDIDEYI